MECPIEQKYSLNIENIPKNQLSIEFLTDLFYLRKTILNSSRVKEYKGVFFNANMSISFINSLLEDMRNKQKLNIYKAYSVLMENQFIQEYNCSIELYYKILGEEFQESDFKSIEEM